MSNGDIGNADYYAYDIHKNVVSKGEAINDEAINVSIENILSTLIGERLFLPFFGSPLPLIVFEQITEDSANSLLYELLSALKRWEDRIDIIEEQVEIDIYTNTNRIDLTLPYVIKRTGIKGTFSKKILL